MDDDSEKLYGDEGDVDGTLLQDALLDEDDEVGKILEPGALEEDDDAKVGVVDDEEKDA